MLLVPALSFRGFVFVRGFVLLRGFVLIGGLVLFCGTFRARASGKESGSSLIDGGKQEVLLRPGQERTLMASPVLERPLVHMFRQILGQLIDRDSSVMVGIGLRVSEGLDEKMAENRLALRFRPECRLTGGAGRQNGKLRISGLTRDLRPCSAPCGSDQPRRPMCPPGREGLAGQT